MSLDTFTAQYIELTKKLDQLDLQLSTVRGQRSGLLRAMKRRGIPIPDVNNLPVKSAVTNPPATEYPEQSPELIAELEGF
jgi:hypothetical protein